MNDAADVNRRHSAGFVAPGFEAVRNQLDAYLLLDPAYSAQLTAYWKGELVVDLVGGADLAHDSVTGVYSVTKGVAAVALSTLVRDGRLDLDARVVDYWPEFAPHGKDRVLVRELLSHRAGLIGLDGGMKPEELWESERAAARLAASLPLWRPGSAFGYHGLTIGVFMEELVRRVTGSTLQRLYEDAVRAPRGIDFWLGLPESEERRFRTLLPMAPTVAQQVELAERAGEPDNITAHMFNLVTADGVDHTEEISPNARRSRAAGFSSISGIGSARGLAQLYSAVIGYDGEPLLDEATINAMSQQQSWGDDCVLRAPMSFGVVFMKPNPRKDFGSYRAFGHDGAGGALGFADPLYGLGFGYIPMPMQFPGGADPKSIELSRLVRQCIRQQA